MKKIICLLLIAMMLFPSALAEGKNTKKSDTGSNSPLFQVKDLSEKELYSLYSQTQSQIRLLNFNTKDLYNTTVNYDELERNPSYYKLNRYCFTGEIIQVIEGSSSVSYRIAKDKDQNQVFLVTYERPENAERFLNGDIVTAYVKFLGLETYKSTTNLSVTVPSCQASLIIRKVTKKKIADASVEQLEILSKEILAQLDKTVKKDKDYYKVTKTNYENYARYENLHTGEKITATGKVKQAIEGYGVYEVRLAVDSDSEKIIYLTINKEKSKLRLLEDDTITIKGTYTGLLTYSSILGGDITVPSCTVETVNLKGYTVPKDFPKDTKGNVKLTKELFEDYSRRPDAHSDEKIAFSAKVLQVIEDRQETAYRMAVDSDSSYVIYVVIPNSSLTTRVLENDKVKVTAVFNGLITYQSTLGAQITIPQCEATSISIPGKTNTVAQKDAGGKIKVTKSNYESFARNEATYKDKTITFTAKVIQAVDGGDISIFRLAVDSSYDAVFYATLENENKSIRILEDDKITVEAVSTGLYSYKSTLGGKITIPSCSITKYTIKGYTQKSVGKPDKNGYYKVTKDNYEEYARNPDKYEGNDITFKAKVLQVVERSYGPNIYRVSVDSDSSSVFYVEFTPAKGASRILEKDIVTIKGEFYGIYTYTTTLGSSVSIPAILATEMKKK